MRKKIVGLLCFIVIGINSLSYSETPDSDSNEAEWTEFMAGVLNVEDEGVEYILPDGRRIDIYDKKNNIGLIGQEVESVLPQAIDIIKEDMDGEDVEDFRLLDTSPLVPILIKAIQELKAEVDKLKGAS